MLGLQQYVFTVWQNNLFEGANGRKSLFSFPFSHLVKKHLVYIP